MKDRAEIIKSNVPVFGGQFKFEVAMQLLFKVSFSRTRF
jgi:hypothetical protein